MNDITVAMFAVADQDAAIAFYTHIAVVQASESSS